MEQAKYRLPFALCRANGIEIGDGWTPRDAWEALKKSGTISNVEEGYEKLEKRQLTENKNEKDKKWNYPGYGKKIDQLERGFNSARSVSKINSVAKGLRETDKQISAEIDRIRQGYVEDGNLDALMTYRRKVRQLMQKVKI